jgi:hypothetical protein
MSFYKNFKALPFKSFSSSSTQKITGGKKMIYIFKIMTYPSDSEGHCAIKITENSYVFFGGAPST